MHANHRTESTNMVSVNFNDTDVEMTEAPPHGVYTTEIYPEAYLPCNSSSSEYSSSADSSPFSSPCLMPKFMTPIPTDHLLEQKEFHMFALPPPPPRIIRKPSKTKASRRNSVLL